MVKIKLTRTGKKNHPSYRIVVQEAREKRDGRSVETLGFYQPTRNPARVELNKERYRFWVARGAVPTPTVSQLFNRC